MFIFLWLYFYLNFIVNHTVKVAAADISQVVGSQGVQFLKRNLA